MSEHITAGTARIWEMPHFTFLLTYKGKSDNYDENGQKHISIHVF